MMIRVRKAHFRAYWIRHVWIESKPDSDLATSVTQINNINLALFGWLPYTVYVLPEIPVTS
jgi:hypothetical protein